MKRWCEDEQRIVPVTRPTIWYGHQSIVRGLLTGALAKQVEALFREISEAHDITIEEME